MSFREISLYFLRNYELLYRRLENVNPFTMLCFPLFTYYLQYSDKNPNPVSFSFLSISLYRFFFVSFFFRFIFTFTNKKKRQKKTKIKIERETYFFFWKFFFLDYSYSNWQKKNYMKFIKKNLVNDLQYIHKYTDIRYLL